MRLGEIRKLEWNQLDFIANTITLRAGETKNDESRVIPISQTLRTLLQAQRAKKQSGCPYVCFKVDRKGIARKIGNFRKVWQSRCVRLGLGKMEPVEGIEIRSDRPKSKPKPKMLYRGLLFHDLRRSAVRNLVRSQVPEKVAMAISGHKTRAVFDRYNIISDNDLVKAGSQLEAHFENHGKVGDNSGTTCTEMQQPDSLIN